MKYFDNGSIKHGVWHIPNWCALDISRRRHYIRHLTLF